MKVITKLFALLMIVGVFYTPRAMAQIQETSFMRLNEPVNIGGNVLQPGVYVISVLPGYGDRNQLQVTNEDRSKVFATVLSIPHQLSPNEKKEMTEFVYYPPIEGDVRALRTWYAPNAVSEGGHDIVYPKGFAMKLAPVVKEPVVAYDDSTKPEDLKIAELEVVTPTAEVMPYQKQSPMTELPATGSNAPLFAMFGMLLLIAAVATRVIRTV